MIQKVILIAIMTLMLIVRHVERDWFNTNDSMQSYDEFGNHDHLTGYKWISQTVRLIKTGWMSRVQVNELHPRRIIQF